MSEMIIDQRIFSTTSFQYRESTINRMIFAGNIFVGGKFWRRHFLAKNIFGKEKLEKRKFLAMKSWNKGNFWRKTNFDRGNFWRRKYSTKEILEKKECRKSAIFYRRQIDIKKNFPRPNQYFQKSVKTWIICNAAENVISHTIIFIRKKST